MINLGQPEHMAVCSLYCGRPVGGPYFDSREAAARLKEHVRNFHEESVYSRETPLAPKTPKRKRTRGSYQ